MKISRIIENVRNFNFFNNELIIEKKDDTICNENDSFKFKGESYTTLKNNCICDIQKEYTDIYNLNFEFLVRIQKQGIVAVSIIDKDIYSVRWDDESENDYSSIYENEKEIKVRDHFYGSYFEGKYRITFNGFNRKEIFFYNDIITDTFLWHYTLPEDFKIFDSVQAIDDVLFFIAYKDNHYQLVTGLDIETGNVLYQNQYEVTNENNFVVAKNLNEEDKLMYGYGHVYQVLNPKTGEIILQKEFKENKEYDLLPSINSIYDNKLWFVSRRGQEAKFGAIDIATSEIDFVQSFALENDRQLDKPVFHQGKLYLHDSNNVLYVLE